MKIAISILGLMQEYFYTKLSIFIQHIISCTQLTEYLVKWRSIKVNVRFLLISSLRYLTFSSVRAVFSRLLPGFRSVADPHSSTRLQIAFTEQRFQPFAGNFATTVWYPKPSCRNVSIRALSSYDILSVYHSIWCVTHTRFLYMSLFYPHCCYGLCNMLLDVYFIDVCN